MEALADELLDTMTPSYDVQHHTFASKSGSGGGGGGVPVRHVTEKRIPSKPLQTTTPNSTTNQQEEFDSFTGIIDGITGEPLNGTRHYALTGEVYEGPFALGGLRHGEGAIVKNVYLPFVFDSITQSTSGFDTKFLSFTSANFFGTYQKDQPVHGTLATDMFTYIGPIKDYFFHGENAELIHKSGYEYRGDFQNGVFCGMGREKDPFKGDYQGEFKNGMKHGMGTFKATAATTAALPSTNDKKKNDNGQLMSDSDMYHPSAGPDKTIIGNHPPQVVIAKRYTYSGMYHCNLRHGEGTEWTPHGEIYTGQFASNKRHGHGILRNARSGITYEGYWDQGTPVDDDEWRIVYPSGDIYVGYTIQLCPNKQGIHKYNNGDVYSGEWKDGQRHGIGAFRGHDGTEYRAEWNNDLLVEDKKRSLDASDCVALETDDRFDTQTLREKQMKQKAMLEKEVAKSLESIFTALDMQKSTTESDNDTNKAATTTTAAAAANDAQKIILHAYPNGDTYIGAMDNSKTNQCIGFGIYKCKNTTFIGEFIHGKRHGYGRLQLHPNRGSYSGEYVNDRKHGLGTLMLKDGSCYHGLFENGKMEGHGTLRDVRNGTVYIGEWKGGKRHGKGTLTDMTDGSIISSGLWSKGEFVSEET